MSTSLSGTLGSVLKWTGKRMFLVFVISLVLTATLVSLAEPRVNNYQVAENQTKTQKIELTSSHDVFLIISSENGSNMDILVEKITYLVTSSNTSVDFDTGNLKIYSRDQIATGSGSSFERQLSLDRGTYLITITSDKSSNIFVSYFNYNLGLIISTVLVWVLFSLLVAAFFTVLPFWIFSLILNAIDTTGSQKQQNKAVSEPPVQPHYDIEQPVKTGQKRPAIIEDTFLNKLTSKDIGMLILAVILFISYLSNPFSNGPLLFIVAIIVLATTYNYFEREKTKERIMLLLDSYPKSSIAFISEQLDKKEKYIIEVLRIMILDEAAPIRMDLINRTVIKVAETKQTAVSYGDYSAQPRSVETTQSTTVITSEEQPTQVNIPETEGVPEEQIKQGDRGQITEPWAYCQQCGEALKQQIKYCYVCGAKV